jgi:hypothetical protein
MLHATAALLRWPSPPRPSVEIRPPTEVTRAACCLACGDATDLHLLATTPMSRGRVHAVRLAAVSASSSPVRRPQPPRIGRRLIRSLQRPPPAPRPLVPASSHRPPPPPQALTSTSSRRPPTPPALGLGLVVPGLPAAGSSPRPGSKERRREVCASCWNARSRERRERRGGARAAPWCVLSALVRARGNSISLS